MANLRRGANDDWLDPDEQHFRLTASRGLLLLIAALLLGLTGLFWVVRDRAPSKAQPNVTPTEFPAAPGEAGLMQALTVAGLPVTDVRQSVMEGFFVEQAQARWFKTKLGTLDVVFFGGGTPVIRVCASQRDGRYVYDVRTTLTHQVINANQPLFFT